MLSSSPSSSMTSSTSNLCEKPIIPSTHPASIPQRGKRPRYVSFVSPEYISPQLDRKRSWTHRWPLLLIRMTILITTILLLDSIVQFIHICGASGSTTFTITCGILSWIVSFIYILSWVRGRINQCRTVKVTGSSGAAVDPEANEGSPLVQHVTKRRSRNMIHLSTQLGIFLMWGAVFIDWLVRRLEGGNNILVFISDYPSESVQKCSSFSETTIHLTLVQVVLWALTTIFIWVDIRRRTF
ncbi:hypothetical protein K7432_011758 [Basidiobolus ranarum]|uniref:Uncharacterized protein n=1 Tax=Basidiobolus ranarum TaxID=34480 RepID=A0ABR2VTC1_9FUNG